MNTYVENINDIIHETSVDFVLRPCAREIHIVQYDKSLPIIKVHLYKEGVPYELPSSAAVHVRLGKLDRTFVYANILGTNEDRTIAYFEITEQMAMIPGRISPVIEVVYQGKVACSSPIPFVIERNPVQNGQIESHDEFPVIYQLESDVAEHEEWIRKYTALTMFDGFVEGESVWDDIAEGETKYCQSGSQTEDVPGENTVIKIDLSQQHLTKSESKALYIKKIIINYTPDGQEEEETYEYTFNTRIFGNGSSSPTIEPLYADLTDNNSGTTLRWYLNYLLAEGVSSYFGNYNGTKGQQFGSNNNPPALISLSTSSLENCTVNSIYVEVSSNSGTKAKCKLTIVNDIWTCDDIPDPQITSDNEEYEWLHEPNGTHLGSSSGGQVIHHYNHVFLKKENGRVSEVEPDESLQYCLSDYKGTYRFDPNDNLLHQLGGGADFELLNKIEFTYDSEDDITYITFPKNILPSVYYEDYESRYLYFDYKNRRIINSSGTDILYNDEMSIIDGKLNIQLSGCWELDPNYDYMQYDLYDGFDNPIRHSILMPNNYELHHLEDIYATIDYVDEEIAYALTTVYKPKGSSTVSNLNNISKSAGMSGDIYNMSDGGSLTNQDSSTVAVLSGDNVVFCWNNGSWYWDKMAATVDLSNYLQKTSNTTQYIDSPLVFQQYCSFNASPYFAAGASFASYVSFSGTVSVSGSIGFYGGINSTLYPNSSSSLNLGMAGGTNNQYYWNNLYLKGSAFIANSSNYYETKISNDNNLELYENTTRILSLNNSTGCTLEKDLKLYTLGTGDSPALLFQRGTEDDAYNDWKIYDTSGFLRFSCRTGSLTWDNVAQLTTGGFEPVANNARDLGTTNSGWKKLYLTDRLVLANTWEISYSTALFFTRANVSKVGLLASEMRLYNYNLYLDGTSKLTDGTNSIAIADIAQKGVDSPQESQPGDPWWIFVLDANGEATIDLEYGSLPDGLYWVTYGNTQAFVYIQQAMIAASYQAPIRVMMPCIYNSQGECHVGILRMAKDSASSTIFRIKITDYNGNHVPQGYQVKFYKTKLM